MPKNLALILLLIVPVLIVGGLYRMGQNTYRVPEGPYTGLRLSLLPAGVAEADTASPVLYRFLPAAPDPAREQQLSDRFYHRLRQAADRGGLRVVHLDGAEGKASTTYPLPIQHIPMAPGRQNRLADSLLSIMQPGALSPGMIFALTDGRGRLQNVYDLSRVELQDTLLIESMIVAGAR